MIALSSCNISEDELDRRPPSKGFAGKYYWAYSKNNSSSDTLSKPILRDELYYDISEFDERSGTFNVDTYLNNQIVKHQVIVNKISYYDDYYQFYWVDYIDESGQIHDHYSDPYGYPYFGDDLPDWFANRSFPFKGVDVRNYFVKYSWGQ